MIFHKPWFAYHKITQGEVYEHQEKTVACYMKHIRARTCHPMTQRKVEHYHRSMQKFILLDNYCSPTELESRLSEWINYYNNCRYHEAIEYVTPSDRFFGRDKEISEQRQKMKSETVSLRRKLYRLSLINNLIGGIR